MSIERNWHPNFIKYMDFIINHPNYKGLPIKQSENSYGWIAPAKGEIGKQRKEWANKKAQELGIKIEPGCYQKVMYRIHPTKIKACQICGREMSIEYIYLNKNFANYINNHYEFLEVDELTSIYELIDKLKENDISEDEYIKMLKIKFNIDTDFKNIDDLIKECSKKCMDGKCKNLGPGCMSNFPDRFDGYHTYNRCCRSTNDTGRSADNLRTYGKDRRAYEYWSDGNIQAANKFMYSDFFKGASADHVGPISLGFVHDSRVLRKMSSGDNSSKRDRLLYNDVKELEEIEKLNDMCVISWYSVMIWEFIKNHLSETSDMEKYRSMLKENMSYYMEILWNIKHKCGELGEKFLIETLLQPKYECFKYDYEFNELGQIISMKDRNMTEATNKEFGRYVRVSLESLDDYHDKENRKLNNYLSDKEKKSIDRICELINKKVDNKIVFNELKKFVGTLESKIIAE